MSPHLVDVHSRQPAMNTAYYMWKLRTDGSLISFDEQWAVAWLNLLRGGSMEQQYDWSRNGRCGS